MRTVICFLQLFHWFIFRRMVQQRWRILSVLVGIALGAAVFTSVRLSIHASLNSFTTSMDLIAGQADRVIIQPGGRVPDSLIGQLLRHPAVRYASPVLTTYVKPTEEESPPFLLIGIDPILDHPLRDWDTLQTADDENIWLELIKQPFTLITGERLTLENNWNKDQTITLEHVRQPSKFRILGILASKGLALVEGGRVAITDISTFQEFTGLYGQVDRIDLIFKSGINKQMKDDIRNLLPAGLTLSSPSEKRESGQMMIRAYQLNLSVLSFVSLFVGMFLVYSLISLNAASRRKELAILRALGTSSNLIFFLFLTEGFVFGMLGWMLAIPVSTFMVKYLLYGISQTVSNLFVRVQVDQLSIDAWEILLSFGVTVMVSILASWQPAREAMRVSPKEAFAMMVKEPGRHKKIAKLAIWGTASLLLVWPVSQIPAFRGFAIPGYLATFFLFVGFSLLAPWMLQRIGHVVAPIFKRFDGEPGYLAARYLRDSDTRTAISVGALITAVALYTSLVIMIHSFRNTVELWVHQSVSGDLFVTDKLSEVNNYRDPLSEKMINKLKTMDVDADLFAFRRVYLNYNHIIPYQLEAMDFKTFNRYGKFFWVNGDPQKEMPKLIRGQGCLVTEVFAHHTGLKPGDTFACQIENVRLKLPILGIVRDYRTHGGIVFYDLNSFNQYLGKVQWSGVRFFFRDRNQDLDSAARKLQNNIIKQLGGNLSMITGRDLRQRVLHIFDETFAVTGVLLIIALVVAAMGIATTLTVQVLERSQQLNTIFAIGASEGQIRSMIFWEALLMVVAGEIAGLLCGFALSYLLVFVINYQSFGWTFLYGVKWKTLIMSLPLIIGTAVLSAFPVMLVIFKEPPATLLREH
jgi:putative ABC transport system permease protein